MVAIKAHQAQSYLKNLSGSVSAVLVYGTDIGLVSELAGTAAKKFATHDDPPGEILRIEDSDLEQDPDRLTVELQTMAMFSGRNVVRTTASRRVTAALLKPLLEPDVLVGALVVEAGNLRADDAMRKLFEKAPHAAAIPCYADEARDLDKLIRDQLEETGHTLTSDARQALIARLGADRALSRAEIDKLALYAGQKSQIDIEDVQAIVGDAADLTLDAIVEATVSGNAGRALRELDRAVAAGESPQSVISALQRHVHRLHRIVSGLEAGKPFEAATKGLRPPLFFKQKPAVEAQCRHWNRARLTQALSLIATAAKDARLSSNLESTIAERCLLRLANLAARRR